MNRFRFLSAMLLAVAVFSGTAWGQSNEGRIAGTIRDSSGGVVVGAAITVTNTATNVSRSLTANSAGEYFAAPLAPGRYTVTAEAKGFKKTESKEILLEVAREIRVDLDLVTGSISETVEVTAEATITDTTDNTLNGVMSNKAVNDLPVQGRDFQNLLNLHPGVQRSPGGGFHSVVSNGNRPDDNNFFIDGANGNDVYYGESVANEAGISGAPSSHLPLDAIQEFNTQESPDAGFGVKPGVVVNIGLKSGTDQIHGSAYYFHRNSVFDARNWFAPAPDPVPALLLHQFGGSLGGPIKKGKWFYFVNYEGVRDKVGNPSNVDSPVTTSLVGRLDPSLGVPEDYSIVDALNACGATCSPLSRSFYTNGLFLPNPGFTASPDDPALINFDFNNTNREDNLVAKTDYVLDPHNTLSASYIYANSSQVEEDINPLGPQWLSTAHPITQILGLSWAYTPSANWVNELRFSLNSFNEGIAPVDHTVNPTTYGINTGVTDPRLFGFPRIYPGSSTFDAMGGNDSWPLLTTPSRTWTLSDTVSYTHGKHTLRLGGDFSRGSVKYFRAGDGRGYVDFNSLEGFVAGDTSDINEWAFLYGDPGRNISMKSFGLFAQDNYRIRPRISLNMGLRYDVTYPINDSRNLLANYVPNVGVVQVGRGINSPYPTQYNNISPRFGIAWDVFGTGKTVVRAGGGIIFEQPSIRTFMFNGGGLNLNPSGVNGVLPGNGNITSFDVDITSSGDLINWTTAGPVFPAADKVNSIGCGPDLPCKIFGVSRHLSTPYVANWNLNVQQALTPSTLLQVAYVANHGINLLSTQDLNQPLQALSVPCINGGGDSFTCEQAARPLTTPCAPPVGIGSSGSCLPFIGFLEFLGNHANSNYNSLQVTLTKRYSHGLYLLAGYTYGHAIDTATNNVAQSAGVPQNSLDYGAERGNGDFDIRNRFTLSATYDLPSREAPLQMLKGWQLNSILTLEGGEPFNLADFSDDISGTGELNDRWNMFGPAKNVKWSTTSSRQSDCNPQNHLCYFDFSNDASSNQLCEQHASLDQLEFYGCYQSKNTVIVPPDFGSFGNMGRNMFRGPAFKNWDFSVGKVWNLNERLKLQFRAEFFNLLNHPNFDVFTMKTNLAGPSSVATVRFTPDVGESNPVIGSGGSRHIQFGLKLLW
jgi:outer membrane receptor protein involved in Fe transport